MVIVKTIHRIIGFDGNSNFYICAMIVDLQLRVNFSLRLAVRSEKDADSEVSLSVWRTGQSLANLFISLQRVKCCGRLTWFCGHLFLLKSMECVCGHKNKRNVCGEVHRWRGRWVQTQLACGNKTTQQSFMDSPPPRRQDVAECKDRAWFLSWVFFFFSFFFFKELHQNLYCSTTPNIWTVSGVNSWMCDVSVFTKKK